MLARDARQCCWAMSHVMWHVVEGGLTGVGVGAREGRLHVEGQHGSPDGNRVERVLLLRHCRDSLLEALCKA